MTSALCQFQKLAAAAQVQHLRVFLGGEWIGRFDHRFEPFNFLIVARGIIVPKLSLIGELNVSISTAFCAQNLDLRSKHLARVRVLVRKLSVLLSVRLVLMQRKLGCAFVGREDIIPSCLHVC
jgi:hypothetical protein